MKERIEPIPLSVLEFEKRYNEKHPNQKGAHNIYHIVAEDRNGVVVDEHFGVNVLTDFGFNNVYNRTYPTDSENSHVLYAGDGDFVTIDPESTTMVHAISDTSAIMTTQTPSLSDCKWDSDLNMTICSFKLCVGYFDYTVWDSNKTITELGVCSYGYNISSLKYHAAIYDANGDKTSFVKKVNEKVTITVYVRTNVPTANIVNAAWAQGIPCAIRSYALSKISYYDHFQHAAASTFSYAKQDNWNSNKYCWYAYVYFARGSETGSITDHVYTSNPNIPVNIFIDEKMQYFSDVIFSSREADLGDSFYNSMWVFAHKIKSPNPITFQNDHFRTFGYNKSTLMGTYGRLNSNVDHDVSGQLPMTDIHISSLKLYNAQTNDYDIDVPYSEPVSYLESGYTVLRFSVRDYGWIDHLNKFDWYTVFINEAPQYPITSISECGRTMYVTDEYWDSTTWDLIADTGNIPPAQGGKRFFIMLEAQFDNSSDDTNLGPYVPYKDRGRYVRRATWEASFPKLTLNDGSDVDTVDYGYYYNPASGVNSSYYDSTKRNGKGIQNETLGYIASCGLIVFPESADPNPTLYYGASKSAKFVSYPYRYHLGGVDLTDVTPITTGYGKDGCNPALIWNTTRGTHIACCGINSHRKGIRVYTITNDPSTPPTYDDFSYDELWPSNTYPMYSNSNNGYVVVSYISGDKNVNKTYVVAYDVEGASPDMYVVEGYKCAFAIDYTNYFCGVVASVSDHVRIDVYDMSTKTVHATIDLPTGYTFSGFAGWKNFIYIRATQGVTVTTFVYYISQGVLESTNIDVSQMAITNNSWYSHAQRAVDSNNNIESCMILLASDASPNTQTHMVFKESEPTKPFELMRSDIYDTSSYVKNQNAWLGYSADGKHLLLTVAARRRMCLDIGWALNNGTINHHLKYGDKNVNDNDLDSLVYYKGFVYTMNLYNYDYSAVGGDYPYSGTNYHCNPCFKRFPFQLWMDMQIIGSTYTINSYMNPVRAQGNIGTMLYQSTNRNVDDPAPAPL